MGIYQFWHPKYRITLLDPNNKSISKSNSVMVNIYTSPWFAVGSDRNTWQPDINLLKIDGWMNVYFYFISTCTSGNTMEHITPVRRRGRGQQHRDVLWPFFRFFAVGTTRRVLVLLTNRLADGIRTEVIRGMEARWPTQRAQAYTCHPTLQCKKNVITKVWLLVGQIITNHRSKVSLNGRVMSIK